MDINFDDLKKEFDALKSAQDFKEEACEIGCDEGEELGFIETIQKYMLAPANCGVYFSRLDIKVIGLLIGEDVQVRERKRMLRDILRSITNQEEFGAFMEAVEETANQKIAVYDELGRHFPHSKEIFDEKKEKFEGFEKILRNIYNDFQGVENLL
ncbi:MAG: hypothetical protein C6H99_03825 [Epsilonproteobacteria bacterium]|nr:hypothetical protein [Campylobacterota bacterium]NPA64937.1 hypothetical protein [Campylobacterota bacterium]